ncbi:MAG: hypothetical protein R2754_08605 [Microthrixaceae bacterium]
MGNDPSTEDVGRGGPLPDGSYDVIVVDAQVEGDHLVVEVTLLEGDAKGSVVSVGATAAVAGYADPIGLLGETGVLAVAEGRPRLTLDR